MEAFRHYDVPHSSSQERTPLLDCPVPDEIPSKTLKGPELARLRAAQEQVKGYVTDQVSFFSDLPRTHEEAREKARAIYDTLLTFKRAKIKPTIFLEPENTLFKKATTPAYGSVLATLFREIRRLGEGKDLRMRISDFLFHIQRRTHRPLTRMALEMDSNQRILGR